MLLIMFVFWAVEETLKNQEKSRPPYLQIKLMIHLRLFYTWS